MNAKDLLHLSGWVLALCLFLNPILSVKAQCTVNCNPEISKNSTYNSTDTMPFLNNMVDCWTSSHGKPKLSSQYISSPTSGVMWAGRKNYGEGIMSRDKMGLIPGNAYIAYGAFKIKDLSKIDTVFVSLSPNLAAVTNYYIPRPSQVQALITLPQYTDTSWKRQYACFTTTYTSAYLWVYGVDDNSANYQSPSTQVKLYADDVGILENFGFAGPDKYKCDTNDYVNVGVPCTAPCLSFKYKVTFLPFFGAIDSFEVDHLPYSTKKTGTYVVTRYPILPNGDTLYCGTAKDTMQIIQSSSPVFSLGPDSTYCQSPGRVWIKPNVSYSHALYSYYWGDGSSGDSLRIDTSGTYCLTITNKISGCSFSDCIVIKYDPAFPTTRHWLYVCKNSGSFNYCTVSGYTNYKYKFYNLKPPINYGAFNWTPGGGVNHTNNCILVDTAGYWNGSKFLVFQASGKVYPQCLGYDTIEFRKVNTLPMQLPNDTTVCGGTHLDLDVGDGYYTVGWYLDSSGTVVVKANHRTYSITKSGTYHCTVCDPAGCCVTDTIKVKFFPTPTLTGPSILGSYCPTSPSVLLNSKFFPPGGTFTGTGVSHVGTNYFFVPSLASCGHNTLTYSYTDTNGCSSSKTFDAYVACGSHIDSVPTLCCNSQPYRLTGNPYGAFSGSGVTSIGGFPYFDPALVSCTNASNTYKIYYDYTDSAQCQGKDSITITVKKVFPVVIQSRLKNFACNPSFYANQDCLSAGDTLRISFPLSRPSSFTTLWSTGSTDTSIIIKDTGTYWVRVTENGLCAYSDTVRIYNDPCKCCLADTTKGIFTRYLFDSSNVVEPVAIKFYPSDSSYFILSGQSLGTDTGNAFSSALLTKMDRWGTLKWQHTFNLGHPIYLSDMEWNTNGIYILGDVTYNSSDSWGSSQAFVLKTNLQGQYQSVKYYGGVEFDHGQDLWLVDSGYYFSGCSQRTVDHSNSNWKEYQPGFANNKAVPVQAWVVKDVNGITHEWLYAIEPDTCTGSGYTISGSDTTFSVQGYANKYNQNGASILLDHSGQNLVLAVNSFWTYMGCTKVGSFGQPITFNYSGQIQILKINPNTGVISNSVEHGSSAESPKENDISSQLFEFQDASSNWRVGIIGMTNTDVSGAHNYNRYYPLVMDFSLDSLTSACQYRLVYDGQLHKMLGLNAFMHHDTLVGLGDGAFGSVGWQPFTFSMNMTSRSLLGTGYRYPSGNYSEQPAHTYTDEIQGHYLEPHWQGGWGLTGAYSNYVGPSGTQGKVTIAQSSGVSACENTLSIGSMRVAINYTPYSFVFNTPNDYDSETLFVNVDSIDLKWLCCDQVPIDSSGNGTGGSGRSVRSGRFFNRWHNSLLKGNGNVTQTGDLDTQPFSSSLKGRVMPNPNHGVFTLQLTGLPQGTYSLEVYNEQGARVFFQNQQKSTEEGSINRTVSLENQPAGIYILRVVCGSLLWSQKVEIIP